MGCGLPQPEGIRRAVVGGKRLPIVGFVRWVKRILIFLLFVVLGLGVFAFWTVRRSFPQIDGEIAVSGLEGRATIIRDDLGVPHIYADDLEDLFFAQGYAHAQDRFWQMDFWRHIGAGRLSEMFGSSQVDTDMFLRSLGFERLAQQEWEAASGTSRSVLQAFADGVNAYIDGRSGSALSLEYAILPLQNGEYEVEPWTPINTLTWAKVMSWDLGGNMGAEIARAVLGQHISAEQVEQLFPPYPDDKPFIVDASQAVEAQERETTTAEAVPALLRAQTNAHRIWSLTGGGFEGIGSNNWAIGGEHTESGKPILANDTHLAIQMPSIWYENGLHCESCGYDAVGFTFPGVPAVVIGHTGHHAWGVTNQAADTQDLFIERVNPDRSDQYEADGEWVDFQLRRELIEVGSGDDVEFEVRSTRNGIVISETFFEEDQPFDDSDSVETPDDYVVALAWRTLEPSTLVEAILGINFATSYQEFSEAASLWDIAGQNMVYADVEGNIAYHATGEVPLRAGGDGRYPVPGWIPDYRWTGFVPSDDMPRVLNPPAGYVATANQPIWSPDQSPLIGIDGAYGYRADRIGEMIEANSSHTVASNQEMQFDSRDDSAEEIVPYFLDIDSAGDESVLSVQMRLESWSTGNNAFQLAGDSNGGAVYMAVWRHLLANTFQDELPEDYWPSGGSRWFVVMKDMLDDEADQFWDDISTVDVETRDEILFRSMADAHRELSDLLGSDTGTWTWGKLHTADFENQTFGRSGIGPIEWLFNRSAPKRVGGSSSIVNAVGWDTDKGYEVDWVPSQRMVVDLNNWSDSTFIHTTGQSGHAFHGDYDSMIEMWTEGEHAPMLWTRSEIEAAAAATLVLVPSG